ncbi:membrane protein [Desulfobulbus elongatus]|uniref:membrane protein n=1 Tax=Desulfobulbus elongatus TaxID=53332 RepID=UPI000487EED7|nr:membrane protein [Desulfobulbus elongatus]
MITPDTLTHLWLHLGWPLLRLLLFLAIGLLAALFIESLNWTGKLAVIARPLTRFGHLSPLTGASFSVCFFSGMAANTMLAEGYATGQLSRRELILANLFNSLPSNFLHLPTTFFIAAPMIKGAAFVYIGLTVAAAILRTLLVTLLGRTLLPAGNGEIAPVDLPPAPEHPFRAALDNTMKRFKRRIRKIAGYTVPIYIIFYALTEAGFFAAAERFMGQHLSWLSWLSPQALSILTFQMAAEFTAGLAAAGSLLASGTMRMEEIVLVLLIGNILSSPIRALRHQYPYYAGIFKPVLAAELIFFSQGFRALSIALVAFLYYSLVM